MNRELRRLQEREERRLREKGGGARPTRRPSRGERTGLRQFLAEVRVELRRVNWPSRSQVTTYSVVVLVTVTTVTLITFGLDALFRQTILLVLKGS